VSFPCKGPSGLGYLACFPRENDSKMLLPKHEAKCVFFMTFHPPPTTYTQTPIHQTNYQYPLITPSHCAVVSYLPFIPFPPRRNGFVSGPPAERRSSCSRRLIRDFSRPDIVDDAALRTNAACKRAPASLLMWSDLFGYVGLQRRR
jgi:hypothetical protein